MKKVLVLFLIICIIALGVYIGAHNEKENSSKDNEDLRIENGEIVDNVEKEKEIEKKKAEEIFANLPKMYVEAISPFDEEFKLNAVMEKIIYQSELLEVEPDFSEDNVNKVLKELFGEEESLDKSKLTADNVQTSMYYYSDETKSYEILPMGFNGVYLEQSLQKVTETTNRIYVYAYCLVGEYMIDDSGKINAVIGDKEGNDLELTFEEEIEAKKWIEKYEKKIPVFRYTLNKDNDNYYLLAVEQIN